MDDKFENDEDIKSNINNEEKNNDKMNNIIRNNKENSFVSFMENYYGSIKQYMEKKELINIGKVNKKLMSLTLIEMGHDLYDQKNDKKQKMRQIINNNKDNDKVKDEYKNDKIKVKNFLESIYMKRIFTYLKSREYIEAFKSVEPTVNNNLLEIYKIFYIILNNEKMVNLYENSKEKFWKKMTDEFVRKSFDGENLNKYIYKLLLDKLSFEPTHVFKINYLWKKYYENKYDIKDITGDSPTTGIFFLIIREYLEWCGIIESRKSDQFILCNILKLDILNIDEKLVGIAKYYNKLNRINDN
jgi:hypothetical protein